MILESLVIPLLKIKARSQCVASMIRTRPTDENRMDHGSRGVVQSMGRGYEADFRYRSSGQSWLCEQSFSDEL